MQPLPYIDGGAAPELDLLIIIVNWNTGTLLRDCLASIHSARMAGRTHTVVVDNCSSDGSADLVETQFPGIELIRSKENLGFSRANNLALQRYAGRSPPTNGNARS